MTAPAAPRIGVRQVGGMLRLCWRPVTTATDYKVYLGPDSAPTGLEDTVNFIEAQTNGWFVWFSGLEVGQVYARVTALNVLAEESAYSNEVYRYMNSDGDVNHMGALTQALDINRKL